MTFEECFQNLNTAGFREYTKIPEQQLYQYSETLHMVLAKLERQKYMRLIEARVETDSSQKAKKKK